ILCGVSIGYYLFHPLYKPYDIESKPYWVYGLFFVLLILEFLNLKCHLILRNLRPRGTKNRGIPHGYGFNHISCANYFYESLIWIIFSLITNTLTGYVFSFVATTQMTIWALKKHKNYKREFPNYPSGTLNENGIKDSDILIFKDLGVQISWRLVYVIEYLGPIIIFPFFYFCDKYVYSHTNKNKHIIQIFSLWFLLFHFIKREFESLFIHRFSNATMPIIRVPINCGHYW
ncbi:3-oxo-5-alpha-steroid 4-dehydrogenase, partial [Plasmodium falciparum CAMP/Malaysia]